MILVNDVSIIKIDGANAKIVITRRIRTFADSVPESESNVRETPPFPVTQSLAFGALSVAPYEAAYAVSPLIYQMPMHIANVAKIKLKIQYPFFNLFLIFMSISSVNNL